MNNWIWFFSGMLAGYMILAILCITAPLWTEREYKV